MLWILLSLLAALVWAISNIIDKTLFSRWAINPSIFIMSMGLAGIIASLAVYFFKGYGHLSFYIAAVLLLNGLLYMVANFFYFKALKLEESSIVIALFYLDPLFTAVLSAIFIGEIFSVVKYIGVILLVLGAALISYKFQKGFHLNKAFWFCVLGAFIFAICNLLTKYGLGKTDYWTVFSYVRLGTFLALIPLYVSKGKTFVAFLKQNTAGFLAMVFSNVLGLLGILFFVMASSINYVTLVTSLSAIQPFLVLLISFGLSIFYPQILKEDHGKLAFSQKLLAIILMFVGVLLIT